jgi:hypothetical protein
MESVDNTAMSSDGSFPFQVGQMVWVDGAAVRDGGGIGKVTHAYADGCDVVLNYKTVKGLQWSTVGTIPTRSDRRHVATTTQAGQHILHDMNAHFEMASWDYDVPKWLAVKIDQLLHTNEAENAPSTHDFVRYPASMLFTQTRMLKPAIHPLFATTTTAGIIIRYNSQPYLKVVQLSETNRGLLACRDIAEDEYIGVFEPWGRAKLPRGRGGHSHVEFPAVVGWAHEPQDFDTCFGGMSMCWLGNSSRSFPGIAPERTPNAQMDAPRSIALLNGGFRSEGVCWDPQSLKQSPPIKRQVLCLQARGAVGRPSSQSIGENEEVIWPYSWKPTNCPNMPAVQSQGLPTHITNSAVETTPDAKGNALDVANNQPTNTNDTCTATPEQHGEDLVATIISPTPILSTLRTAADVRAGVELEESLSNGINACAEPMMHGVNPAELKELDQEMETRMLVGASEAMNDEVKAGGANEPNQDTMHTMTTKLHGQQRRGQKRGATTYGDKSLRDFLYRAWTCDHCKQKGYLIPDLEGHADLKDMIIHIVDGSDGVQNLCNACTKQYAAITAARTNSKLTLQLQERGAPKIAQGRCMECRTQGMLSGYSTIKRGKVKQPRMLCAQCTKSKCCNLCKCHPPVYGVSRANKILCVSCHGAMPHLRDLSHPACEGKICEVQAQ